MQRDETIDQALRRLIVVEGVDPVDAANDVVETGTRARLAEAVFPLILSRARSVERTNTRHLERTVFDGPAPDLAADATDRLTRGEAVALLNVERFPGVDGFVTWGVASAADHIARAEWQRGHAMASVRDAEHHEKAAALIDEHGASCLDEIENWADKL